VDVVPVAAYAVGLAGVLDHLGRHAAALEREILFDIRTMDKSTFQSESGSAASEVSVLCQLEGER